MAFRHPTGGGEVPVLTPEEAEEAELAAEFAAEEAESAARVEALRLDAEVRDDRIAELANPEKCTGCRLCEWLCPDYAIRVHLEAQGKAAEEAAR